MDLPAILLGGSMEYWIDGRKSSLDRRSETASQIGNMECWKEIDIEAVGFVQCAADLTDRHTRRPVHLPVSLTGA